MFSPPRRAPSPADAERSPEWDSEVLPSESAFLVLGQEDLYLQEHDRQLGMSPQRLSGSAPAYHNQQQAQQAQAQYMPPPASQPAYAYAADDSHASISGMAGAGGLYGGGAPVRHVVGELHTSPLGPGAAASPPAGGGGGGDTGGAVAQRYQAEFSRMPVGAGRSLKERNRKAVVEQRLELLGKEIAVVRMQLKRLGAK
ncbi:hypothetical protein TSOC_003937 [Tetrabaena socialis]|uniref:Uncharacterized protein n=1 Tax=Tetrabaena socialis TaxID=47790 RepID=A0A2J8AAA2_9CHLO|nr:hypothetical protein TSOC_003937 [Tetrabaena socialis]|eukprot:PNH09449.1 hypothetical protein TSOC_003937 [Tetrabaena socialis]